MATTVRPDGLLAEDCVRLTGLANGDTYTTKLGNVELVYYGLRDASGSAIISHSISGRVITFVLTNPSSGAATGTVDLCVRGRL